MIISISITQEDSNNKKTGVRKEKNRNVCRRKVETEEEKRRNLMLAAIYRAFSLNTQTWQESKKESMCGKRSYWRTKLMSELTPWDSGRYQYRADEFYRSILQEYLHKQAAELPF